MIRSRALVTLTSQSRKVSASSSPSHNGVLVPCAFQQTQPPSRGFSRQLSKFMDNTTFRASNSEISDLQIPSRVSAIEAMIHAPSAELQRSSYLPIYSLSTFYILYNSSVSFLILPLSILYIYRIV